MVGTREQLERENRELLAEREQLRATIGRLSGACERQQATIERLVEANRRLESTIKGMAQEIARLRRDLARALGLSQTAPTVPSGQIPVFLKPAQTKKAGKPGRKPGHPGASRPLPAEPDREVDHPLEACPHCDGPVKPILRPDSSPVIRFRYVEDVVPGTPETVKHAIRQYWCRRCKRRVEPIVTAALPGCRLGLRVVVQTAVQHFLHAIPVPKIVRLLREEQGFIVTEGGLVAAWRLLTEILVVAEYDRILVRIRQAGVLWADETGWRVNGASCWLWCFCTKTEVAYLIDESRGSNVATSVLGKSFGGTLIQDFYAAYNACNARQTQNCLAHLLREFDKVEAKHGGHPPEAFVVFQKKVTTILKEAIDFHRQAGQDPPAREAARVRFERRLLKVLEEPTSDPDAQRLIKRMWRSADALFTFLTTPGVEPTNNWAELTIRAAVVMRKNSGGSRSQAGADDRAVLMSVFRTYEMRGLNAVEATIETVERVLVERHRAKYLTTASDR